MPIKGMGVVVEMEGVDELLRKLKRAGAIMKDEQEAAFLAGAKVIRDEANARAPTSNAVITEVEKSTATSCVVKVRLQHGKWYLRFFEFGAARHGITHKKAAALAFEGDEGPVVIGGVDHPGMVAQPFLRPAFDTKKDAATKAVKEYLERRLKQLGG